MADGMVIYMIYVICISNVFFIWENKDWSGRNKEGEGMMIIVMLMIIWRVEWMENMNMSGFLLL